MAKVSTLVLDWFMPNDYMDPLVMVLTHEGSDYIAYDDYPQIRDEVWAVFGGEIEGNEDDLFSDWLHVVASFRGDVSHLLEHDHVVIRVDITEEA